MQGANLISDRMSESNAEQWFKSVAGKYNGALITLSSGEDNYFFFKQTGDSDVVCLGPAPGQIKRYSYEEFKQGVESGTITLANEDPDNEVFHTPDGEQHW